MQQAAARAATGRGRSIILLPNQWERAACDPPPARRSISHNPMGLPGWGAPPITRRLYF